MPLVNITFRPGTFLNWEELGESVTDRIRYLVARSLSCEDPGGRLTDDDISVIYHQAGRWDHLTHDIQVVVDANDFPSRRVNLDARTHHLEADLIGLIVAEGLQKASPDTLKIDVWQRLFPAGFSEGTF